MHQSICALHGFLGTPCEWDYLRPLFSCVHLPDLQGICQQGDFFTWSEQLPPAHILVGYSLGGRIAMDAFFKRPNDYQALILISAHPGLEDSLDRKKRHAADELWAKKFITDENALKEWNQQPLFKMARTTTWPPHLAAHVLRKGSLSHQPSYWKMFEACQKPILYISGSLDSRFCAVGSRLHSLNHTIKHLAVANAAHRVHIEEPEITLKIIATWLKLDANCL